MSPVTHFISTAAERFSHPLPVILSAALGIFVLMRIGARMGGFKPRLKSRVDYAAFVALALLAAEVVSFEFSCWLWGGFCFWLLREYFTLVDIRLQDRYAVWAAYLSIPFMLYYAAIDWYNMFIITIPVYSFLLIPLLISLGGTKTEGAVYSVGAICFGLFLFVYCVGHLAYLSLYSTALAGIVVLGIVLSDLWIQRLKSSGARRAWFPVLGMFVPAPVVGSLCWAFSRWTGVPAQHAAIMGALIPALVVAGNHTVAYIGKDLGIPGSDARAGRGGIIENAKPMLFAAPIILHYYRYFVLP